MCFLFRDDRKVELISDVGELFTITQDKFNEIMTEHDVPVTIHAELLNNHIVSI